MSMGQLSMGYNHRLMAANSSMLVAGSPCTWSESNHAIMNNWQHSTAISVVACLVDRTVYWLAEGRFVQICQTFCNFTGGYII
jgi:hypothetical protein